MSKYITILFFLFLSCKKNTDLYSIPTYSKQNNINAVIEIPAGTNKKFEYNKKTKKFEIDKKNGKERVIDFLPYVGNYGYIPSTYSNPKNGGDGDALDILVLSESLPTGTVEETKVIGLLKLIDDGEIDYKIIAIPIDETKQIIKATNYREFSKKYPKIKEIIEIWFLNYNKDDKSSIKGWGNEREALEEIKNEKNET